MGVRILVKNEFGHKDHLWESRTRKLNQPKDTPDRLVCWCGEVVEQVK